MSELPVELEDLGGHIGDDVRPAARVIERGGGAPVDVSPAGRLRFRCPTT